MEPAVSKILDDALALPPEARAAVVVRLVDSLDEAVDADSEAAWLVEVERRLGQIDSGDVSAVPWAEARRQILEGADD